MRTHIETQQEIHFKSHAKFLMCSTYKVPIAICLLHKVEQSAMRLTDFYAVTEYDLRPGAVFTLNEFDYQTSFPITIRNLLQLMLQESCNTSTNILLRMLGGPSTVANYLQQIGINDLRVDRTVLETLAAWDGIAHIPSDGRCTMAQYKKLEMAVLAEQLKIAREKFKAGVQDTTTPAAMVELLTRFYQQELISAPRVTLLLNIMRGCKRDPKRLMGLLLSGTALAHKTGTLTGYTCDVGVLNLPHDYGHIAIAVYIKNSDKELAVNERVLAEVGRTIYDFYLFHS